MGAFGRRHPTCATSFQTTANSSTVGSNAAEGGMGLSPRLPGNHSMTNFTAATGMEASRITKTARVVDV